jgi:hypothetical protein
MKAQLFLIILFTASLYNLKAQNFNHPESIVFDSITGSYFISNMGGNVIHRIDSMGESETFISSGLNQPKGLLLIESILYVANNTSIHGYDINTSDRVFEINIPESQLMNGITTNSLDKLYVSDTPLSRIYEVSIYDTSYSILSSSIPLPNGLHYANNTIYSCTWGNNASIYRFSLNTSEAIQLISEPLIDLDGITQDECGYFYISSFTNNQIIIFDSTFSEPPIYYTTLNEGPADIFFNAALTELSIPYYNSNQIEHLTVITACNHPINLTYPESNAIVADSIISLTWTTNTEFEQYSIQISVDSTFESPMVEEIISANEYQLTNTELEVNYFWRVKPHLTNGISYYTRAQKFTRTQHNTSIRNVSLASNYFSFYAESKTLQLSNTINYISIYDIHGKQLIRNDKANEFLSLSTFSPGIYIIRLGLNNGTTTSTKFIIP